MDDLHQMPVQHPGTGGPPPRPGIVLPDRDWDHMTLDWAQYQDQWELGGDGTYYALRFVYYATNILSRNHQYMNIFVPAAYLHDDGTVNVDMTFTAPSCPQADFIFEDVRQKVESVTGVTSANVNMVFEPVWDLSMATEEVRMELGFD